MKKTSFQLLLAILIASLFAFKVADAGLSWASNTKFLGKITQGKPVEVEFEFTNADATPLIITNVKTTCGCTATSWPKDSIAPGESSVLKVRYNAASLGNFNKSVRVFTDRNQEPYILKIAGEVVVAKNAQ